ncbi:hypothetical protein BU17DRAFT_80922 [Hysterangium stoloniferum]|nr:hypothetical protein BU17DRAFT_80922 [Hysterangium stoloniferum]
MPPTSTNIANSLDAQNRTIEDIYDVCRTPQYSGEFGRQECSCHLRVKFRAGKVHTTKRFRRVKWYLQCLSVPQLEALGLVLGTTNTVGTWGAKEPICPY